MDVGQVFQFAGSHMLIYIAPVMLAFAGIIFSDEIVETLHRNLRRAKHYK